MFSTVPGLDSPNADLRSCRLLYVSEMDVATALLYKKSKDDDSFSNADMVTKPRTDLDEVCFYGGWERDQRAFVRDVCWSVGRQANGDGWWW